MSFTGQEPALSNANRASLTWAQLKVLHAIARSRTVGWTSRSMRSMRLSSNLLQLLPQSPLSEVPDQHSRERLRDREQELLPVSYFHLSSAFPMHWCR